MSGESKRQEKGKDSICLKCCRFSFGCIGLHIAAEEVIACSEFEKDPNAAEQIIERIRSKLKLGEKR